MVDVFLGGGGGGGCLNLTKEREEHDKPTKLKVNLHFEWKLIHIPSTNFFYTSVLYPFNYYAIKCRGRGGGAKIWFCIIRGRGGVWRGAKLYYIIIEWPLIVQLPIGVELLLQIYMKEMVHILGLRNWLVTCPVIACFLGSTHWKLFVCFRYNKIFQDLFTARNEKLFNKWKKSEAFDLL